MVVLGDKKIKTDLTIEEIFCGIPDLLRSFQAQEEKIAHYKKQRYTNRTKEELIQRKEELLKTATNMNKCDLWLLYYMNNLEGFDKRAFRFMLENLYKIQCELKNKAFDTEEYRNVVRFSLN